MAIINLTDPNDMNLSDELVPIALKILRKVIEKENEEMTTPAAEWESGDWANFQDKIVEKQNMLCSLNIVRLICRVINKTTNREIIREALNLAIACLLGGNNNVQMAFLEHFKQDRENLFLGKLKNIMMSNYFQIKEIETKKNVANKKTYDVMEMRRNIGEEDLDDEIHVESE